MNKTFYGAALSLAIALGCSKVAMAGVTEMDINNPNLIDLDLEAEIIEAGTEFLSPQDVQDMVQNVRLKMDDETTARTKSVALYPVSGGARFLAGLGVSRSGGRRHAGVDLGAPMGKPVLAMWSGRVVYAKHTPRAGWAVKIEHPNGLTTIYAHLNGAPAVRAGQTVKAGQKLGGVGMSGNARGTTPHLHLEVRRNGSILNPLNYIRRG